MPLSNAVKLSGAKDVPSRLTGRPGVSRSRAFAALARWPVIVAALTIGASRALAQNPTDDTATLPAFKVHAIEGRERPAYEIALLAPRGWSNHRVKRAMLRRAAVLSEELGAACFAMERAGIDRHASYIPLGSGHMTISMSDSAVEWRRYWRLYRQSLREPGIHLGLGQAPRLGSPVVRAMMDIEICPPGGTKPTSAFQVARILGSTPDRRRAGPLPPSSALTS